MQIAADAESNSLISALLSGAREKARADTQFIIIISTEAAAGLLPFLPFALLADILFIRVACAAILERQQ
jgi:hypothetical protein